MARSRDALVAALQATAAGDKAAFAAVYDATSLKLFGIVLRILVREDLAAEVLQDVYLRVWLKAGEFNPSVASPITWLATIARNCALDEVRRRVPLSLEEMPQLLELAGDDDPAAEYENLESLRRLNACLDALDDERRSMIMMIYYRGLTREEVARQTGRPVATVKTWLRRTLAGLKECLEAS